MSLWAWVVLLLVATGCVCFTIIIVAAVRDYRDETWKPEHRERFHE